MEEMRVEKTIFDIFKSYNQWLQTNNIDDNIDSYMSYLEETGKIHIFKYECNKKWRRKIEEY